MIFFFEKIILTNFENIILPKDITHKPNNSSKFIRLCNNDKYVLFDIFADMESEENNVMFKGKATVTMIT